jgi:hypothetical protein
MRRRARALAIGAWPLGLAAIASAAPGPGPLVLTTPRPSPGRARVVVLDDGVKVMREVSASLEESPWPRGTVDLSALRGETVALQVVIEARDVAIDDARVLVEPFRSPGAAPLAADVTTYVERFVPVTRPSGNDREPGSLAFTAKAAPRESFVGAVADALVPARFETAHAAPHERAALWIDVRVPEGAAPGTYRSEMLVRDSGGELASRTLELRVQDALLPKGATSAFVYYDNRELTRRLGDARAEADLRETLRGYGLDAIHDLTSATLASEPSLAFERAAIPFESVLAYGAYGALGEPTGKAVEVVSGLDGALFGAGDAERDRVARFVYAIDEDCASPWPARWKALVAARPELHGVRVGATCGRDPMTQAADLVLQTGPDYDPQRARVAEEAGKWVWAYNGRRPFAGPMMLDVPAVDLRANAWIAMRYGVPRWFYWEATAWFDDNRGGRGGERGFDPYVVAETFHNADGDHADGDGILLYPGKQPFPMTDYGQDTVFPSVRLANLRRGLQDAGYIALARAADRQRADAVVRRMIPRALAFAGERVAWPSKARAWLDARRELAAVIGSPVSASGDGVRESAGCSVAPSAGRGVGVASVYVLGALFLFSAIGLRARARARSALGARERAWR